MTKIHLVTDFYDWYDHWFDSKSANSEPFVRTAAPPSGLSRLDAFKQLKEMGETVIANGTLSYWKTWILSDNHPNVNLVVYDDQFLHAGNGKTRMTLKDALENYPLDTLASLFIETANEGAVSYKYLQIGFFAFWLKITSKNDWRTNVDAEEVEILDFRDYTKFPPMSILGGDTRAKSRLEYRALYAIDYVQHNRPGHAPYFAIDLNWAPGTINLGIKDHISAKQAVDSIKDWISVYGNSNLKG